MSSHEASPLPDVPALRLEGLTHRYPAGARAALDGVSLSVPAGQILAILGPNGGGKTTLFRILTTLLRPTSGQVRVFGHDPAQAPTQVRQCLGVVFQTPSLDAELTVRANLRHQGELYGLAGTRLRQQVDAWLQRLDVAGRADDLVRTLSGGLQRRVEIAKAMLHEPRLLLLDEPSTGLDPAARLELWRNLETLRQTQGVTIILTTHFMDEADRSDRVALLAEGQLAALDTPEKLKQRIGGEVIRIAPVAGVAAAQLAAEVAEKFGPWSATGRPRVVAEQVHLEHADGPALLAQIAAVFPARISSMTVARPTLEDVFLQLTGRMFR